jgi:LPS sulfotransferase NodH
MIIMVDIPFVLRHNVIKYTMFLMGRVGSTYLTQLLNSHPDILALHEELLDLEEQGAEAQLEWTRNFLRSPLIGRYRVRGFNTKPYNVLDLTKFGGLLQEYDCKILYMQRRNRIKTVVSVINGRRLNAKTGKWGLFDESNRPKEKLIVNFEEFENGLKFREEWDTKLENFLDTLRLPILPLYYEDLLLDKEAFIQSVFKFLEVEPKIVKAETLKITNDDLRKVIANFDELRARYVGTQYETMFDEVLQT